MSAISETDGPSHEISKIRCPTGRQGGLRLPILYANPYKFFSFIVNVRQLEDFGDHDQLIIVFRLLRICFYFKMPFGTKHKSGKASVRFTTYVRIKKAPSSIWNKSRLWRRYVHVGGTSLATICLWRLYVFDGDTSLTTLCLWRRCLMMGLYPKRPSLHN